VAHKLIILDLTELEKLAAMHCTQREVAAWFGVTHKTISYKLRQKVYAEVWERGWAKGNISLRRQQAQRAEAGDRTMLVWLGKQWLGQADKQEITHLTLDTIEAEVARLERELARND
jgi:IS30 family transposase